MSSNQSDGAVVTGAASGIGRAIAAGLAADGFSVVIADLGRGGIGRLPPRLKTARVVFARKK